MPQIVGRMSLALGHGAVVPQAQNVANLVHQDGLQIACARGSVLSDFAVGGETEVNRVQPGRGIVWACRWMWFT